MRRKVMKFLEKVHIYKLRRYIKEGLYKYQLVNWFLLPAGHRRVTPWATYSPWSTDTAFLKIFDRIKEHSLVDIYRCYELWQLVAQCVKLKGAMLEIGVWRGGTASLICKQVEHTGQHKKIYLADTFRGVVKTGGDDTTYKDGYHNDTSREVVEDLLKKKLALDNFEILEGIFPDDTGSRVKDETFCFCHIDVDAYRSAQEIVTWLWPRLVPGGIIVFDDYGFSDCDGITKFVNDEREKKDRLVIHNLNGHAVVLKLH